MSKSKDSFPDLHFLPRASRQRHFLQILLPPLQACELVLAAWLSGSYARDDGDPWSDLNLHVLVQENNPGQTLPLIRTLLDRHIEPGWHCRLQTPEMISGLTYVYDAADAMRGGVHFVLRWTGLTRLQSHLDHHRPLRLLFIRPEVPDQVAGHLAMPWPALSPPDPDTVAATLDYFWSSLSRLPAVLNRREHLAAAELLTVVRHALIDLVVALNGAQRPPSVARINQYLGPSQLEAFEKTLCGGEGSEAAFIGQAVALIVLYRWYAPQVVQMYGIANPTALEHTVLALLSAEVEGWPALIQTA